MSKIKVLSSLQHCISTVSYDLNQNYNDLLHLSVSSPRFNFHHSSTGVNFLPISFSQITEGKNQALVGALPFCGEYPSPRSEDKFRSSNQMDGISIADGDKMADS